MNDGIKGMSGSSENFVKMMADTFHNHVYLVFFVVILIILFRKAIVELSLKIFELFFYLVNLLFKD